MSGVMKMINYMLDDYSANIIDECGSNLKWGLISFSDNEMVKYKINLCTPWFLSISEIESSKKRIHDFITQLQLLTEHGIDSANFISEDGKFELTISKTQPAHLKVSVMLIENMLDDNQIKFNFITNYSNIVSFYNKFYNAYTSMQVDSV